MVGAGFANRQPDRRVTPGSSRWLQPFAMPLGHLTNDFKPAPSPLFVRTRVNDGTP